jgi:hypothetical protein
LLNFLPIHLIPCKYGSCQSVKSMIFSFFSSTLVLDEA